MKEAKLEHKVEDGWGIQHCVGVVGRWLRGERGS